MRSTNVINWAQLLFDIDEIHKEEGTRVEHAVDITVP